MTRFIIASAALSFAIFTLGCAEQPATQPANTPAVATQPTDQQVAAKPQPQPEPEPAPKVEPKTEPKPEPKPEPEPKVEPEPKSEPKPEPAGKDGNKDKLGSPKNPVKVSNVKAVKVDGDSKEWNDIKPLPLPFMKKDAGSLKLSWNKDGLYGLLAVEKKGEIKVDAQHPWAGDCIELFIEKDCSRAGDKEDTENAAQYAFAPGEEGEGGDGTIVVAWGAERDVAADMTCAWKKTDKGYILEFFIPSEMLDPAKMKEGTKIGLNFAIDKDGKASELFFSDKDVDQGYRTPSSWGAIILDK